MSPEAQRIAIAKACGRVQRPDGFWFPKGSNCGSQGIPDYLNDLNAMHEAEKVLSRGAHYNQTGEFGLYVQALEQILFGRRHLIDATAPQRAEAFLRTIGKWEEEGQL